MRRLIQQIAARLGRTEKLDLGPSLRSIVEGADRRDEQRPDEHWVMAQFAPDAPAWRPNSRVCPVGSRTRAAHLGRLEEGPPELAGAIPFNEEYFQWIDLLSAVLEAGPTFTFAELGAGYGRWTSRAAGAARRKGKAFRAVLAEGEPRHAARIPEHMADNDIGDYRLFEAAVGDEARTSLMSVQFSEGGKAEGDWYGQSIGWRTPDVRKQVGEHHGRPVLAMDGLHFIEVQEIPLATVLAAYDRFDLVDLDIQGAEARAIRSAIEPLNAKVRRLYVETHNTAVEEDLRDSLGSAGWVKLRDYPQQAESETPFGRTFMEGGVQSWINPRLHRP